MFRQRHRPEYGAAGSLVNIAEYLDQMPNFKAYLDENPIVRLSITGDTTTGAIYFSPYFDGVNDIERMPLMRVDWVQKLLDGEGAFSAEKSNTLAAAVYEPYMPTAGKGEIDVVNLEGTAVETMPRITTLRATSWPMNDRQTDGSRCQQLRTYIDRLRRLLRRPALQPLHRPERRLGRRRAGCPAALRGGKRPDAERHRFRPGPVLP